MEQSLELALILVMTCALIVAVSLAGNELARRERLKTARRDVRLFTVVPTRAGVVASSFNVATFTAKLSSRERAAWLKLPRYTPSGYKQLSLPADLRARLRVKAAEITMKSESNYHLVGAVEVGSLAHSAIEKELVTWLSENIRQWSGQKQLTFINSYGPRTYHKGATLLAHGDRIDTHALSAIVFLGQTQGESWPLQFVTNHARTQDSVMNVVFGDDTDVLLYESTQPHGRVTPLDADSYTAMFLHWKPKGWSEAVKRLL